MKNIRIMQIFRNYFLSSKEKKLVKEQVQTVSEIKLNSTGEDIKLSSIRKKISSDSYGLIIVFGGDGLFLSASKVANILNLPILGINFGKIGFLVDVDKKDILKKVYEIINGDYITDKRMQIDSKVIDVNDNKTSSISLNDVVIYNYGLLKMIQASIFINDVLVNCRKC